MTAMDYVHAEEAYTQAISLDESSVKAYRGLADDYVAQERFAEAEAILIQGYQSTGEEVLLQNYAATVLNGVVHAVNTGTLDFAAAARCLDVLEVLPGNADALELLATCAQRLVVLGGESKLMLDGSGQAGNWEPYAAFMDRLFLLAQAGGDAYKEIVAQYAMLKASRVYMSISHADFYRSILERAGQLGIAGTERLLACLDRQGEVSAYFAPMFAEFEAQNYEAAKAFITTQQYSAIRDAFINDTMEYWQGDSYVPVTKEAVVFLQTQEGWKFSYVEDDSLAPPTGTIRVLAQTMRDLDVQRSSIEYAPAYERGSYYPHVEYEIVYWNTMVSGIATDNTNVVSRMNYRFAEKIYTASGMEANMIYDWGGPNEKRKKE